jgi:NAD(P)-dependent dehydrogenase (short-subunit alcohol dehydrogenase family)
MKTVLVTGCTSGVGRATALAFLDDDWTVYATARDSDDVTDLATAGCETPELDVTDDGAAERVVERVVDEQGRIDCLVNNAGYAQFGPLEDVPVEALHHQFDVNVYGPHRLVRAALPHMRAREDGTIVNVSSANGRVCVPGTGAYGASKFALEAMSDALRGEVEEYGVDVVLVEPGPVESQFNERAREEFDRLERSGAYERIDAFYEDGSVIGGESPIASPPEAVAETILEAGVSPDPDPRYTVGAVGWLSGIGRLLPDRVRDAGFRLVAGLL